MVVLAVVLAVDRKRARDSRLGRRESCEFVGDSRVPNGSAYIRLVSSVERGYRRRRGKESVEKKTTRAFPPQYATR